MIRRVGVRAVWALGLSAAAVFAVGGLPGAQGPVQAGGRRVHVLERYGDAPLPPMLPRYSPRGISRFGESLSVQVNVGPGGANIVGDAANEPSICVDPLNPNRIAIGWRQFDNVASNFRKAGYGYSVDGGASWTFPGVLENNVFRSDPVLASDANGRFYYLSLMETFYDDLWESLNGGQVWSRIAPATGGDKQWMAIDKTDTPSRGFIYQAWSTAGNNWGGRQFSRTTDGGATWMDPIGIPNSPVWGTLDVASNGDLYVVGSASGSFRFLRSSNAKDPLATPVFDLNRQVSLGGSISYGGTVNPGGLTGQAWVAVDRSTGPTSGNIYMLCSVRTNSSNPCDVRFARSTDGGDTWSQSIRINDDPVGLGRWHWFGTMSVAPNGRIDAVWNDTRDDPTSTYSALYYSYSYDGGLTWSANEQMSGPFNHFLGYPNQNKMGDYMGSVSDAFGVDVAYAATFNGEQDVYYLRIPARHISANPSSFLVDRGLLVSGGLSDLLLSDDSWLRVQVDISSERTGNPISVVVDGTSPTETPSALGFCLEARSELAGIAQYIELFDWTAGQYVPIDSRYASSGPDATVEAFATGDLARFVQPGTKRVRARLGWSSIAVDTAQAWGVWIDQSIWKLLP